MSRRVLAIAVVIALVGAIAWRCRGGESPPPPDAATAPPLTKARIKLRDLQRQQPGSVRGTVTSNQAPVAGALVCSRPSDDVDDVRCATTDAKGAYELAELRPAAYQLWATSTLGAARWPDKLTLEAGAAKAGIDFVVSSGGAELAGRVRDTHGRLVANALVHVRVDGEPLATTRTDPRGAFRVRLDGTEATVEATAEGYVDASLTTAVPATGLELVLLPEATLAGIVVEAGSKTPIADAKIYLDGTRLTSNDDGTFRARKLRPGRYKPTASSIGGYGEAKESVLLRVGSHVDGVVIEVHPVAVVAGRIVIEGTDKGSGPGPDKTGCPEGDGNVMLDRRGSRDVAFGKTILDGDVLIEGVVPGVYAVRLTCAGYLAKASYPDLVVGGTDVEDVVWPVSPGGTLAGRVRTKSGEPVTDAAVTVNAGFGHGARVRTGADGRFEAVGLPAGEVTASAIQSGYASSEETRATVSLTSVTRVELVLGDKTGSIVGTVTDRAGKPVADARVELRTTAATGGNDTSDLHGAFEIAGLDPGRYDVVVASKWQLSGTADRTLAGPVNVRVERGVAARVQLQVEREDGTITGVVVDERGAPVADVAIDVALTSPELEPRRRNFERTLAWTSPTGTFEITGIPAQPVAVRARIDGANEAVADHVQPGQQVRLVLESTGSIAGVVGDPSGASVDDITLEIEDRTQGISRRERLFHTGGAFTFRELPAGTYRLTADEDRQTSVTVTLAAGERREKVQLALRPRHTVKGRLVDAKGKPLPNYKLDVPHKEAIDRDSGRTIMTYEVESTATDARGEFLIQGIVGAEVTISAGSLAAGPDPEMIELPAIPLVGPPTIDVGDVVLPPPQ